MDACTENTKLAALRPCPLGSALGLTRQAGELVAVAYSSPKTGYKNPNAYGARPVFNGETTNQQFIKRVRAAADSAAPKKKLMPYQPNAPRNRPKESLRNIIGRRYGPHPTTRTERYKGESHVTFHDADPESRKPWKTTNQVFSACAQVQDIVGLSNAGISSDVAMRMHKTQGVYS
eukprot:jgi/Chrzof1/10203/Cz04g32170.t1